MDNDVSRKLASYTNPKALLKEMPGVGGDDANDGFRRPQKIIGWEKDYRRQRLNRVLSLDRKDAFAMGDKTSDVNIRTYSEVMTKEALQRDKEDTLRSIAKKKKEQVGDGEEKT